MMNLAIVIPYYKLTFFEETLNSLANQTNKQFNVYIGNDASPENPEKLLQVYENKFNLIYEKFETNLGRNSLVKQWDRCINLTKNEEWLMILGDDDVLDINVVDEFCKFKETEKKDTNVFRYSTFVIDETSKIIYPKTTSNKKEEAYYLYYKKAVKGSRSSLSEYIFRKDKYKKYGFYEYPFAWCSDDRAVIEFSDDKPVICINESFVNVRLSSQGISGSQKNKFVKYKTNLEFRLWYYFKFKHKLSEQEILKYLYFLELLIKSNDTISINRMRWLFFEYLKNFQFIPFLKLTRRFLIRIIYGK